MKDDTIMVVAISCGGETRMFRGETPDACFRSIEKAGIFTSVKKDSEAYYRPVDDLSGIMGDDGSRIFEAGDVKKLRVVLGLAEKIWGLVEDIALKKHD